MTTASDMPVADPRLVGLPDQASRSAPRVGLFGKLGTGNIGNDASMESVLQYLRIDHPDVVLDAMCGGAAEVTGRYGIPAIPLYWFQRYERHLSGLAAIPLKLLGKGIDIARTAAWVRRHDAVIVPGMGVLEASLPLRPWEFPYAMFLLSAFGRIFGTKVALVSVGAGVINQRMTRWLFNWAARLAYYRSYRNVASRDAMVQRGLDATTDHIYPDLAFALPAPPPEPGDGQTVCVGVMAYRGSNDERKQAERVYTSYVTAIKHFIRWLVDGGRKVRLIVGDTNGSDDTVLQEILADLRESRPDLDPSLISARPVATFDDVMQAIQPAGSVVAIRFHNVVAALKLCKPIITIGYSVKHDALMTDMGVPEFCQPVRTLDVDRLIRQFAELQSHSADVRDRLMQHNTRNQRLLDAQFSELSAVLFPAPSPAVAGMEHKPAQPAT
jgi:polysaccharide pyruvyl transferase WcaK-like protein